MWSESWSTARIESTSNGRRHISLTAKRAGEPSVGNRHARFDVAGAGNGVGHLTTAPVLDPTGRTYGAKAPVLDPTSPHSRVACVFFMENSSIASLFPTRSNIFTIRAKARVRYDPVILGLAAVVLTAGSLLAGFIPARSAASIEPIQALRTE
jgi:hypothetical protein